jgi:hypothetical protein
MNASPPQWRTEIPDPPAAISEANAVCTLIQLYYYQGQIFDRHFFFIVLMVLSNLLYFEYFMPDFSFGSSRFLHRKFEQPTIKLI